MIDAWRLAVGTLTALPTRPPAHVTATTAGRAMLLAPVATAPLALGVALGWGALRLADLPALLVAALVLGGLALATRGLHLDGLADTCDGLAASYDRSRALAVMRSGDVGPAGVAAVVLTLLVQAAALAALLSSPPGAALAGVAVLTSRHTLAWCCRTGIPAARPEGLGATVAGTVASRYAVGAALLLGALAGATVQVLGMPFWTGPAVVAAGILTTLTLLARARRRLGGVTGDVLGASVELSLTAALVAGTLAAAVLR